jgi:hypothetical protein
MTPIERITQRTIAGPLPVDCPQLGNCIDTTFTPSQERPTVWVSGRKRLCARVVLEHALGRPIASGKQANHLCNRPSCVRATHIVEGTPSENSSYAYKCGRLINPMGNPDVAAKVAAAKRGRARPDVAGDRNCMRQPEVLARATAAMRGKPHYKARGARNSNSKLTEEAVRVIRFLSKRGVTQTRLARAHGITQGAVFSILSNRTWAASL